jgi:hypothetical protein
MVHLSNLTFFRFVLGKSKVLILFNSSWHIPQIAPAVDGCLELNFKSMDSFLKVFVLRTASRGILQRHTEQIYRTFTMIP